MTRVTRDEKDEGGREARGKSFSGRCGSKMEKGEIEEKSGGFSLPGELKT